MSWAARSSKTSGDESTAVNGSVILKVVMTAGPYVYIFGLIVLLSCATDALHSNFPDRHLYWVLGFGAPMLVAGFFSFTLDINEFSMHSFYRNRLTRCYLGASNLERDPSRVTGFDDRDTRGLQVSRLRPCTAGERCCDSDRYNYPGPYPIFCCSMNITHGEDLGWQERKAASFAFTPLYSGYDVGWSECGRNVQYNGFVPTRTYVNPDGGPNLATAMAISGAAVSPNWGYHTNPAIAFLLTMFDVRLGRWVPNPRRSSLAGKPTDPAVGDTVPSTPKFVPLWLLQELLGSIDDTSAYIYLTDGGHFDNMGLYELVRRHCYQIVICDAEGDESYVYEGIGMAIRKCRIDLGAEIDLDLSSLTPNTKSKLSPAHIARGTIRYPETPQGKYGDIIYIKSSLTGKFLDPDSKQLPVRGAVELPSVPGDVQNYKLQHLHFPHDSTVDQWFTESQFESYRRLGQCIAEKNGFSFWRARWNCVLNPSKGRPS